jgi:hypothetical protein
MSLTPWLNHSWHVTLYVTARGLTTSPIFYEGKTFQIDFDFIDHVLRIDMCDGARRMIPLRPFAVADFYAEMMRVLKELGITVHISDCPSEIPGGMRFSEDREHASYDAAYAHSFWRVLLQVDRVFKIFRTSFRGKCSPVHFFWGSFDLAVTRFSGSRAPMHPGGVPNLSDAVVREAYSQEECSAGFWPGGGAIDYPAFYSYAYPAPAGFESSLIGPSAAFFSNELKEFILPYDAVRTANDPDAALLEFLQSTYEAAANAGKWDRAALECPPGKIGAP